MNNEAMKQFDNMFKDNIKNMSDSDFHLWLCKAYGCMSMMLVIENIKQEWIENVIEILKEEL